MRKLMWTVVGFAVGCAVGAYLGYGVWLWLAAAVLIGAGVLLYFLTSADSKRKILALLCIGFSLGGIFFGLYDGIHFAKARLVDGLTVNATVEITDFSYKTNYSIAADGFLELDSSRYQVRIYVSKIEELRPGDRISGDMTLYFTGSGGIDDPSYLQSSGIHFQVFPASEFIYNPAATQEGKYFPVYLRHNVLNMLDTLFPEDTAAFAKALLLGQSNDLSAQVDTGFRNSGIRHIIAVSGLHVSILFSMIAVLTGRRKWATVILGIPVLVLFAAVAGFTPSVTRACIMQGLILLALAFDQEYDPPTALAFAVLVLLLSDPMNITSIGFQLSVGCVMGIFLFYEPIHSFLLRPKWMNSGKGKDLKAKLIRWFVGSISVSTSAMAFTLPLSAIHFQSISLIGVLSNLLTLWAVTYVFYGVIAACICGVLWIPLGSLIAWVVSWLMRYVTTMAIWLGRIPFAYIPADNIYVILWIIFLYALALILAYSKKKHIIAAILCLAAMFGACILMTTVEGRKDAFRMSVLDVGQGQCILLQSGDACYMVDCGGDNGKAVAATAVRALWNQGIYKLNGIILTHYDEDHVNGLLPLIVQLETDVLYLPETPDRDKLRPQIENAFTGTRIPVTEITQLTCGQGIVTIIPAFEGTRGNESSLCILFQAENCDILITGDRDITGEGHLLKQFPLPDIEILVAGHHGADDSTGLELLRRLKPEIVVISVGKDNKYGHPEQEMLDRLELFGCQVFRTDELGTVIFRR